MKNQNRVSKITSWIKELFKYDFIVEDLIWFVVCAGAGIALLVKAF